MTGFIRAFPLEDIRIRSGGDGRTVEAYAAVFERAVRIRDHDGEYEEVIDASAFNRTIDHKGTRFGVFYNHALDIYGNPSDRYSMPIGTPIEVRADSRGVLTVVRYNQTPVADEVLEAIRTGAITGQSFSGSFVQSDPAKPPRGGYKRTTDGGLVTVRRLEVAMREFGPTPFPAYEDAEVVGVRQLPATTPDRDPERADTSEGSDRVAEDSPERHSSRHNHMKQQAFIAAARQKGYLPHE